MDNRSHDEATWDLDLIGPELQSIQELDSDFDLALTGFDQDELNAYLFPEEETTGEEDLVSLPPVVPVTRPGDLWLCGEHRVLCADSTSPEAVARLLEDRKPFLMVTDPPYGIELDSEWRDRAGLNGCGPAESSYMKHAQRATRKRKSRVTHARIGRKRSRWCRASRSGTSGTHRSSRARCSTGYWESGFCITSKSSGTRGARC